jgi:NodT family efflux transporter outer membrane factor (OMF) lipoprotein
VTHTDGGTFTDPNNPFATPTTINGKRVKTYHTEFGLGLQLSYEVDLWGRVRSTANAAQLDLLASQEDLHTAAITLSMEVANTWYQLVEKTAELRLLQEQMAINESYLNVIVFRFRNGDVSAVDVLQQDGLLEATNTEYINVQSQIKVLKNKLAVLVGEVPERFEIEPAEALPALPPLPDTGIPTVWMNDRPDLKAAYLRIQSADQRTAAAVADQFPRLSLSASASTSEEQLRDLFDNWMANMAANLVGPIFDGFRRQSEVQRTRAVAREKLHIYGDLILKALQEVENALKQEHYQHQLLASVEIRLDLSQKSNQQILNNYINGDMDFLRYLTSQVSYQELQRVYLQRQLELVQYRINLYRALGRSWLMERNTPPSSEIPQARKPQEEILQTETVNG